MNRKQCETVIKQAFFDAGFSQIKVSRPSKHDWAWAIQDMDPAHRKEDKIAGVAVVLSPLERMTARDASALVAVKAKVAVKTLSKFLVSEGVLSDPA